MKLYYTQNEELKDRILISEDRKNFYAYKRVGGLHCLPHKLSGQSNGIMVSNPGQKRKFINNDKVIFGEEFTFAGTNFQYEEFGYCEYDKVQSFLKYYDLKQLEGELSRYAVGKDGKVYSVATKLGRFAPSEMKPSTTTAGYKQLCFTTIGGKKKHLLIHRLMASMFLGMDLNCKLDVDHINGCKTDNRLHNLRVCSRKENLRAFRDRVLRNYVNQGRDVSATARAMNITKHKVMESLLMEGIIPSMV